MFDMTEISVPIKKFILDHFPSARQSSAIENDSLLEKGIIDSLGVLDLVNFIENEFDIMFSDEELVSDVFESIDSLSSFVKNKLNGRG